MIFILCIKFSTPTAIVNKSVIFYIFCVIKTLLTYYVIHSTCNILFINITAIEKTFKSKITTKASVQ